MAARSATGTSIAPDRDAMERFVFSSAPSRVYWEITRACGLACRHCRAEATRVRDPNELSHEESLRLLDQLAASETSKPHVIFTGGDPLERDDLFDLIAAARGRGLDVSVSPSATPRLDEAVIRRFHDAGVSAISLSIDGSTADRHDALRGVAGCMERTLRAAQAAREVSLPFQVNTLVARETVDDLSAILTLVRDLAAPRWSLFFLVAVGRGTVLEPIDAERCESLMNWLASVSSSSPPVITTTEAPHYRRVLLQSRRSTERPVPAHGRGIRDGNGVLFISHDGNVYPSGFFPLAAGNVRTTDPLTVYRQSPLFNQLRAVDTFSGRCGLCEFRHACGGSRARAYEASGDPVGEDPLCNHRPKGSHLTVVS